MPSIYYSEFLGNAWGEWEGGFYLPETPVDFSEDHTTVTMTSHDGLHLCYAYDSSLSELTWCEWNGDEWTRWVDFEHLATPPNWLIDEVPSQFSIATQDGVEWAYSYSPVDGSLFWSAYDGEHYTDWSGPVFIEDPPNLDDASDVFVASDGDSAWMISVNLEDWTVFYAEMDGDIVEEWAAGPELVIPEEWLELGVDLDGDAREGRMWIYATVYDDDEISEVY